MQRDRLTAAADKLDKIGIRPHVLHAANSAAVLTRPDTYFTLTASYRFLPLAGEP